MDQKTEIRSCIKCRIRLNKDSKQIFNELCGIYGPQTILMRTVFWWVKAFIAGKLSVEDDTRPGRPKTSVTKANIAAVKIVVEQDARLSVKDIASCIGISEGSVQIIPKRFVLHGYLICSLRSKRHNALNVPGNFLKRTKTVIVLLTGDQTWVHMFEPQSRAANKQWKRKDKTPMYCQENHKFEKDFVRNFL